MTTMPKKHTKHPPFEGGGGGEGGRGGEQIKPSSQCSKSLYVFKILLLLLLLNFAF